MASSKIKNDDIRKIKELLNGTGDSITKNTGLNCKAIRFALFLSRKSDSTVRIDYFIRHGNGIEFYGKTENITIVDDYLYISVPAYGTSSGIFAY